MGRIEDSATRYGIPIHDRTASRSAVTNALAKRGIHINGDTVRRVRKGYSSGEKIASKLEMTGVLEGNAAKKDTLYSAIASKGMDIRTFNRFNRPNSPQFVEAIAKEINIDPQDVRRSLRAMRADVILQEQAGIDPTILGDFIKIAATYIDAYTTGHKKFPKSPVVASLNSAWDSVSIEGFYRSYYQFVTTTMTARTWIPFEVEFFNRFYRGRISNNSPVSPLDRLTMAKNISSLSLKEHVEDIRNRTGIPYDGVVHFAHTNALLYGQPTRPSENHSEPIALLVDEASPTSIS